MILITHRSITENEIEEVREACLKELLQGEEAMWGRDALNVVEEFAHFCYLLSLPENHIEAFSGQYVKRQVNTRMVKDMTDEMAQELMKLPRFTAYAKVIQEQQGEQIESTRKIKTLPLPPESEELLDENNTATWIIERTNSLYCKKRSEIEEEIRQRQERWRNLTPDSKRLNPPSVEPPPTSY